MPRWGLAAFGALALASLFLPPFLVYLLTVVIARGLVVLGLMLLWRTGLMSFGQALYFGIGGYAVGLAEKYWHLRDAFALVALAVAAAAVAAFVLGFLLRRYRDIFFAMLSLAFSMILYGTLVKSESLGSTDGFTVLAPHFLGWAPAPATAMLVLAVLALALAALAAAAVGRYLASPLGHLATAIRDNELRVEYLGYPARRAIHAEYLIAAVLAAAGGALVALAVGHIDPDLTYWTTSGEFVFVTILAGPGSVFAPFLGAAIFEGLRTLATAYAPYSWQLVLGASLLALILFLPRGVWSLFERRSAAR